MYGAVREHLAKTLAEIKAAGLEKPERVIAWPEAREMVLSAYNGFAPEMAAIAVAAAR